MEGDQSRTYACSTDTGIVVQVDGVWKEISLVHMHVSTDTGIVVQVDGVWKEISLVHMHVVLTGINVQVDGVWKETSLIHMHVVLTQILLSKWMVYDRRPVSNICM